MINLNEYDRGFISGFLDADGSLIVIKRKTKNVKKGWSIDTMLCFSNNDKSILEYIQEMIGVKGTLITVQDKRSDRYNDQSRLTYNAKIARELLPQLKLIHKEDKRLMMIDILNTKRQDHKYRYDFDKLEPKLEKWFNYKYDYGNLENIEFNSIDPTEFDIGYFKGFLVGDGSIFYKDNTYRYTQLTNNSLKIIKYLRDISCKKPYKINANTIDRIIPTYRLVIFSNSLKNPFNKMDKKLN